MILLLHIWVRFMMRSTNLAIHEYDSLLPLRSTLEGTTPVFTSFPDHLFILIFEWSIFFVEVDDLDIWFLSSCLLLFVYREQGILESAFSFQAIYMFLAFPLQNKYTMETHETNHKNNNMFMLCYTKNIWNLFTFPEKERESGNIQFKDQMFFSH